MRQQGLGVQVRVDPELLRQVAEDAAHGLLVLEDVDIAEARRSLVRLLQRRDGPHERGLARAVRTDQPEHARGDGQRDAIQRHHPVRIRLRDVLDAQFQVWLPVWCGCPRPAGRYEATRRGSSGPVTPRTHETPVPILRFYSVCAVRTRVARAGCGADSRGAGRMRCGLAWRTRTCGLRGAGSNPIVRTDRDPGQPPRASSRSCACRAD